MSDIPAPDMSVNIPMSDIRWIWGGAERDKFDSLRRYLSEADHVAVVQEAEQRVLDWKISKNLAYAEGFSNGESLGFEQGQRDALAAVDEAIGNQRWYNIGDAAVARCLVEDVQAAIKGSDSDE